MDSAPEELSADTDWPLPPFRDGDWRELDEEMYDALIDQLFGQPEGKSEVARRLGPFYRVRVLPLSCYPGWLCVEVLVARNAQPTMAWFLYGPYGAWIVGDTAEVIHRLNAHGAISLDTDEQYLDYLRLFAHATRGDEGQFFLVESVSRLGALLGQDMEGNALSTHPRELTIEQSDVDARTVRGIVLYGNTVFEAVFRVTHTGLVEMIDDEPIGKHDTPSVFDWDGPHYFARS